MNRAMFSLLFHSLEMLRVRVALVVPDMAKDIHLLEPFGRLRLTKQE